MNTKERANGIPYSNLPHHKFPDSISFLNDNVSAYKINQGVRTVDLNCRDRKFTFENFPQFSNTTIPNNVSMNQGISTRETLNPSELLMSNMNTLNNDDKMNLRNNNNKNKINKINDNDKKKKKIQKKKENDPNGNEKVYQDQNMKINFGKMQTNNGNVNNKEKRYSVKYSGNIPNINLNNLNNLQLGIDTSHPANNMMNCPFPNYSYYNIRMSQPETPVNHLPFNRTVMNYYQNMGNNTKQEDTMNIVDRSSRSTCNTTLSPKISIEGENAEFKYKSSNKQEGSNSLYENANNSADHPSPENSPCSIFNIDSVSKDSQQEANSKKLKISGMIYEDYLQRVNRQRRNTTSYIMKNCSNLMNSNPYNNQNHNSIHSMNNILNNNDMLMNLIYNNSNSNSFQNKIQSAMPMSYRYQNIMSHPNTTKAFTNKMLPNIIPGFDSRKIPPLSNPNNNTFIFPPKQKIQKNSSMMNSDNFNKQKPQKNSNCNLEFGPQTQKVKNLYNRELNSKLNSRILPKLKSSDNYIRSEKINIQSMLNKNIEKMSNQNQKQQLQASEDSSIILEKTDIKKFDSAILRVKIRIDENDVKELTVRKDDDVHSLAIEFCSRNSITDKLISPIINTIEKAKISLNQIFESRMDEQEIEKINKINKIHKNFTDEEFDEDFSTNISNLSCFSLIKFDDEEENFDFNNSLNNTM